MWKGKTKASFQLHGLKFKTRLKEQVLKALLHKHEAANE